MSTATNPSTEGWAYLIAILAIYFVPGIVATMREHRHSGAIWVLNLFLGWTLLGWVVALVWAAMHQPRERPAPPVQMIPPSPAPAEDGPAPTGDVTLDLRAPWRRYPSLERYNEETEAEETRRGEKRR